MNCASTSKKLRAALFLLLALGFFGCPPPTQIRTDPSQVAWDTLHKRLFAQRQTIRSLEGRAKLRIYRNGKRQQTARLFFQIERPNRLNLQVVAAFQQPALIVTCDGKEFAIHNLLNRQFLRGPAERLPQFLDQYLPAPLSLDQLILILLGEMPILPSKSHTITPDAAVSGHYIIQTKGHSHSQKIWLSPASLHFTKSELLKQNLHFILTYGTYRGHPPIPGLIRFQLPKQSLSVSWIISSHHANQTIDPANFRQTPPKDIPIQQVR